VSDPIDPGREVVPPPTEAPDPPLPPPLPLPPAPTPVAPMPAAPPTWAPSPPAKSGSGNNRGLCCVVAIAIVALLLVVALFGLIFLGSQVSSMLSTTGQALGTVAPSRPAPTAAASSGMAPAPIVTLAPLVPPASMVTGAATPEGTGAPLASGPSGLPHQAPEVEALAPASVNGLPLTTWSVKGAGWLELAGLSAADSAALRKDVAEAGGSIDDFAQVISGRTSVENDPPYFIYIYRVPGPSAAFDAVLPLILGTAGWKSGLEPDKFQTATLGGKQVHVGTVDMLAQSEHQKGRPYWYELDAETLAIVITDKEAWAADALSKLP
jgi:hypothetical protein